MSDYNDYDNQPIELEQDPRNRQVYRVRRPSTRLYVYQGKPLVTYALIAANVIMFIFELITGATGNLYKLVEIGGSNPNIIVQLGQWWRLLSAAFLHASLTHIAFNMYALFIWGRYAESLFGSVKFFIIYMLSAFAGSALSFALISVNTVSVGASGAIFGLFGMLLYFRGKHREAFKRTFGIQIAIIITLNIVIGFITPGIDNYGHIGGLLGGYCAAMLFGMYKDNRFDIKKLLGLLALLALLGAALSYGYFRIALTL